MLTPNAKISNRPYKDRTTKPPSIAMDQAFSDRIRSGFARAEDEHTKDEDESDMEEESDSDDEEWPWLKKNHAEEKRGGRIVASCVAYRIDRKPIRANFYTEMEEPTQDLAELAFDLFDRWGCVKDDFLYHPVKKGTGTWGEELNGGKILFFQSLTVEENFRRQGIGRKLAQNLWAKVIAETSASIVRYPQFESHDDEECKFALVWPTHLNTGGMQRAELENLSPEAREQYFENSKAAAIAFWRSLGFRRIGSSSWFGLAASADHPSRQLSAQDDYNPPPKNATQDPIHNAIQTAIQRKPPNPLGFASQEEALQSFLAINDTLVSILEKHLRSHPETHPSWKSPDKEGNTIAHIGVRWPKSLEWLLDRPMYINQGLYKIRNHQGETPAELFESTLKDQRVRSRTMNYSEDVSDQFQGYGLEDTHILLRIQGKNDRFTREEFERVRWGCTCGDCTSYLSPRNRATLSIQAIVAYDRLASDDHGGKISSWIEWNSDLLRFIPNAIMAKFKLKRNKALRDSVANIFQCIYHTLSAKKQIPTAANVVATIQESGEGRTTREYLSQGGTVASIVLACFDHAIDQDIYSGDGSFEESHGEDVAKLPKCRNDHEFAMAMRNYKEQECVT